MPPPVERSEAVSKSAIEYRVWWIPQIPMEPFEYPVPDIDTGALLCDALAKYDLFQFENKVKPDYCNTGGMSWRHPERTDGEWYDFDPRDETDLEEVVDEINEIA